MLRRVSTIVNFYWINTDEKADDWLSLPIDLFGPSSFLPCLQYLSLTAAITNIDVRGWGKCIGDHFTLKVLKLSCGSFEKRNMELFWKNGLSRNTSIEVLEFDNCRVNDAAAAIICKYWLPESRIRSLTLSNNLLRPRGANHIIDHILCNFPSFDCLNLNDNPRIDFAGLTNIANSLTKKCFKKVFLRGCVRERVYYNYTTIEGGYENLFEYCPIRHAFRCIKPFFPSGRFYPLTRPNHETITYSQQLKVNEDRAHQERLISEVCDACILACTALNTAAKSGFFQEVDLIGNGFDSPFIDEIEFNALGQHYHIFEDCTDIPESLWCIIFSKLQGRRSTAQLIYTYLRNNPIIALR
jgi:hypothetical protein